MRHGFRTGCDSGLRAPHTASVTWAATASCGPYQLRVPHRLRRAPRRLRPQRPSGCDGRDEHACDQVILHTEHTLGLLPRCVFCRLSVFLSSFDYPLVASLKSTSCLSKFAQTWREKPAKHSDLVHFSGKSFRLGEKIRRAQVYAKLAPPAWRETRPLPAFPHKKPGIYTK